MKHMFDFWEASYEMNQNVNKIDEIWAGRAEFFEINPKVLQLKWTDIEVWKYWLNEMQSDENDSDREHPDEEIMKENNSFAAE